MQKSLQDMAIDKKAVIRELPAEREGDEPLRIVYASQYYYLELSTARMLHELNITCEEDREAIEKRIGKIEKNIRSSWMRCRRRQSLRRHTAVL